MHLATVTQDASVCWWTVDGEIGAYMLLLLVSFIIDDCTVNPNLSVCHMCFLFLTMMMMMMMNKMSVCIIPVFQRQSESNDVSFVHKRIIFYIV